MYTIYNVLEISGVNSHKYIYQPLISLLNFLLYFCIYILHLYIYFYKIYNLINITRSRPHNSKRFNNTTANYYYYLVLT